MSPAPESQCSEATLHHIEMSLVKERGVKSKEMSHSEFTFKMALKGSALRLNKLSVAACLIERDEHITPQNTALR